ncbi:Hairy/enhancer-of-split with YRPW motif protein [Paragonimus heterotremus]|uniref:Hairy/enhancer-of-split with YRPW motif protein n=1 Tax=Paragonimus heterotremus TaxID=100268 RepID=A0A8J4SML1_9TREM|nr:Hairy/enhancer-of-split with YRPW motif protein [Paragonimus heterotremus]
MPGSTQMRHGATYGTDFDVSHRNMLVNGGPGKTTHTTSIDASSEECGNEDPGSPYTPVPGTDRKRRRGQQFSSFLCLLFFPLFQNVQVIEKRRRDRINCSLYDLKRLIPDMTRKPVSVEIMKGECCILAVPPDATVLSETWLLSHVLGSEARAIELRRAGFKECLMEVTRLLSTYEGVGVHCEEMRRALLAHLHQHEQQREFEFKTYLANVAAVAHALGAQNTSGSVPSSAPHLWTAPTERSTHPGQSQANYTPAYCDIKRLTTQASRYPIQTGPHYSSIPSHLSGVPATSSLKSTHPFYPSIENNQIKQSPHKDLNRYTHVSGISPNHCFQPQQPLTNVSTFSRSTQIQSAMNVTQIPASLGPNESQSTSSPPFHSTPEDTELHTSPQMLSRLIGLNESHGDMNGKHATGEFEGIGKVTEHHCSILAQLKPECNTPLKCDSYTHRTHGINSTLRRNPENAAFSSGTHQLHELTVRPSSVSSISDRMCTLEPTIQQACAHNPSPSHRYQDSTQYPQGETYMNSTKPFEWDHAPVETTDTSYGHPYWQYPFQTL